MEDDNELFAGIDASKHLYDIDENGDVINETTETPSADDKTKGSEQQDQAGTQQQSDAGAGNQQDTGDAKSADKKTSQGDGKLKEDGKGNLVDEKGNIVAHAGADRRRFHNENGATVFRENTQLRSQLRQRDDEVVRLRAEQTALNGMPQRLNLNTEEASTGLNLIAQFKRDPIAVAQYVVAEAMKLGHNVQDIIKGQNGSLEMGAITRLIDDKLKPLTDQQQQQEQLDRANATALREYNTFVDNYPDAVMHEDAIANLMGQDPNLTVQSAYYELKLWAQSNELDWKQPLRSQLVAKMQTEQGQQQSQQTQSQGGTSTAMPRGTTPTDISDKRQSSSADATYEDIIRQAMRETGMSKSN
jgi:hypothetical protein